ncbi:hypothetical protein V8E36_006091 [Tilletia maclaganii]
MQRDTIDAPKSRLQRIMLLTVPLRFPFTTTSSSSRGRRRPAAAAAGGGPEGHFGTSGEAGALPIRIRVVFLLLNVVVLAMLGLLGFHPHAQEYVTINDKALHFLSFFVATCLCYGLFDVDESARRIWVWRHFPLLFSLITCLLVGSIGSEFVQALLPFKTFDPLDIVANLVGSSLGLVLSYHAERRYRARRELERLYQPLDADDEDAFELDLEFGLGDDEDDEDGGGDAFGSKRRLRGASFEGQRSGDGAGPGRLRSEDGSARENDGPSAAPASGFTSASPSAPK